MTPGTATREPVRPSRLTRMRERIRALPALVIALPVAAAAVAAFVIWALVDSNLTRASEITLPRVSDETTAAAAIQQRLRAAGLQPPLSAAIAASLQANDAFRNAVALQLEVDFDDDDQKAKRESLLPLRVTAMAQAMSSELADLATADDVRTAIATCLAGAPSTPCRGIAEPQRLAPAAQFGLASIPAKDLNGVREDRAPELDPAILRDAVLSAWTMALTDLPGPAVADDLEALRTLDESTAKRLQRILSARVAWLGSAVVLGVAALIAIGTGGFVIYSAKTKQAGTFVFAAAALAALIVTFRPGDALLGPQVVGELLKTALGPVQGQGLWITSVLNGAVAGAAILLLAAMSFSLTGSKVDAESIERLDVVFTASAALLAAGVIEIGALYRLPASLVEADGAATHLEELAESIATGAAFAFSAALILAYVTTYSIAAIASPGSQKAGFLANQLPALLKVFAPAWLGLSVDQLIAVFSRVAE